MSHISGITVLGDGLSDQGMFGRLTGGAYPPSPPFHAGRWTGGSTWVELLAADLGVSLSDSDNLAQGGATTGWFNINEPLRQALHLGEHAPIRGVLAQVQALVAAQPDLDPQRLFVIWAGGHDFGSYLESGFPDVVADPAAHGVTEIVEPYLPMDYIDFANPLVPARPLPADRAGRSPEEFLTFWAVSAGPAVHRAIARRAALAVTAALPNSRP